MGRKGLRFSEAHDNGCPARTARGTRGLREDWAETPEAKPAIRGTLGLRGSAQINALAMRPETRNPRPNQHTKTPRKTSFIS